MKKWFLLFSFTLCMAANRPYNDIIKAFNHKGCTQRKENIFLSKKERKKIEKQSGVKLYGGLALRYITTCTHGKSTFHYVDSHIVRTLNQTVVLSIKNDVFEDFVVSSFNEPPEYKAPKKWYQQFKGATVNKKLKARKNIDVLSGATLTVNASINVVNKTLALHKFLKNKK